MGAYYYVNKNSQSTGEHEVHTSSCTRLPNANNRQNLGYQLDCKKVLAEAKKYYQDVDGCYYCSSSCHKK